MQCVSRLFVAENRSATADYRFWPTAGFSLPDSAPSVVRAIGLPGRIFRHYKHSWSLVGHDIGVIWSAPKRVCIVRRKIGRRPISFFRHARNNRWNSNRSEVTWITWHNRREAWSVRTAAARSTWRYWWKAATGISRYDRDSADRRLIVR